MIKDIKLYIATWSRQDTDNLLLLGIKCQGSVCWNIAAYTSDRRTPLLHESYQVRRLTVSNKGSQRVGMKLMRGDKIHSSLQFQGWRSWDLRKVQRLIREERSLMRDIIEGGSSNISVCVCVCRQNTKHALTVPSRCESLYGAQISTWYVSLITVVCKDSLCALSE